MTRIFRPLGLGLVVALEVSLTSIAVSAPGPARWKLVGTTVGADQLTPVPNVEVTLYPDSLVTQSDPDGDFLFPWSGERGWLTVTAPDPNHQATTWCKRVAFELPEKPRSDRIVDVGRIAVTPRIRFIYQKIASPPAGTDRPEVLHLPGPAPGEPDTCQFRNDYTVDLWGGLGKVNELETQKYPPALHDAVIDWLRHTHWIVSKETTCDDEDPFKGAEEVWYVWSDTAWVQVDPRVIRRQENRRRREAEASHPKLPSR